MGDHSEFLNSSDSSVSGKHDSFLNSNSGIDWSKTGEEGLIPLAPTDVIGKGLQMYSQSLPAKISGDSALANMAGKMMPETLNEFGTAVAAGPALNAVIGGVLSTSPAQRAIQWAADKIGIGAPALAEMVGKTGSGITKPGPLLATGSEELQNQAAKNYVSKAMKLHQTMGEPEPDIAIGNKLSQIIQKQSQKARQVASAPFDAISKLAEELPIATRRPNNLATTAREIGLLQENIPPSLRLGRLGSFLRDEASLNPSGRLMNVSQAAQELSPTAKQGIEATKRSLPELISIRQELAGLAKSGNAAIGTNMPGLAGQATPSSKFFYDLVDAIDKDIAQMSKGTDLVDQLKQARQGWKAFKDVYSNPIVEGLMNKNPSDLAEHAFKSPENINALKSAGGEPALALLRKGIMNDIVNQGSKGIGNTNIRNPNAILDSLLTNKSDEMDRLFLPSHIQALRDFAGAREYMLRSIKAPSVQTSNNAVQKALAISSKFLPPGGKFTIDTLKTLGGGGAGAAMAAPGLLDFYQKIKQSSYEPSRNSGQGSGGQAIPQP